MAALFDESCWRGGEEGGVYQFVGGGSVVCCCREECSEEHGIVLTPNFVNCIMKVSK